MDETTFIPLATLTQRPVVAKVRIERPLLLSQLNRSDARVIIIKAPAGFGKTTLAVDWSLRVERDGARVSWLRACEELDEPSVFLRYLAISIDQACPGAGRAALEMLRHRKLAPTNTVAGALINSLVESGDEIVLVIDEFDRIANPEISQLVWFLIQHGPFQFRVIITTREEPAFPLGEGYASGEVMEIVAGQLRFSLDEATRFFCQVPRGEISDEQLQAVHHKTGGWPAAIRMMWSALQSGVPSGALIQEQVTGGRLVEHYFEASIRRLPEQVVRFMVVSSILAPVTAAKCDHVLQTDTSGQMLDALYHKFQVIMRDRERGDGTYIYSAMIASFLEKQARKLPVEEYRTYQHRAAEWCDLNGQEVEAIRRALEAGEFQLAAVWIERCGMQLVKSGNVHLVLGWLRWIPSQLMRTQFRLRLAIGWVFALSPKRSETFEWLDALETDAKMAGTTDIDDIHRECLALRATTSAFSDMPEDALKYAIGYQESPLPDPWTNNALGNVLRYCYMAEGQHELAEGIPWYPMAAGIDLRAAPIELYRQALLGFSLAQRLRLNEAEACFTKAREVAAAYGRPKSCISAIPEVFLANLAYERNQLDVAEGLLESRIDTISASGFVDVTTLAYTTLARIAVAQRDFTHACRLLVRGEQVAVEEKWPRMHATMIFERICVARAQQDQLAILSALAELEGLVKVVVPASATTRACLRGYLHAGRAVVWVATGRYVEAIAALEEVLDQTRKAGNLYQAARIGALLASAEFAMGRVDAALGRFLTVVGTAARAGMIRSIVNCDTNISGLVQLTLERLSKATGSPEITNYLERIQSVLDGQGLRPPAPEEQSSVSEGGTPLAPRELEVLRLMAEGQSNKRIAINMLVSPETVKWYIKNIFLKLEVDNRMRAVTEGRRRNLL